MGPVVRQHVRHVREETLAEQRTMPNKVQDEDDTGKAAVVLAEVGVRDEGAVRDKDVVRGGEGRPGELRATLLMMQDQPTRKKKVANSDGSHCRRVVSRDP